MTVPPVNPSLLSRLDHVKGLIGNTPLYEISRVFSKPGVKVYAKLEWMQMGGSVKARAGYNIIRQAILRGQYGKGQTLIDATSGNTGIAYASVGAALGLPVKICLPETASQERIDIMRQLGADLVLTPGELKVDGSQQAVREFYESDPEKYFLADQYANPDNLNAHVLTTGPEIMKQTHGRITHFVAAAGTSGTTMGMATFLKEHKPDAQVVVLQPDNGDHTFEGWKHMATTGRIPPIYDPSLIGSFVAVNNDEADEMVRSVAKMEGLMISPSAAGNLVGAIKVANSIERGVVVTTFADDFTKYSADYTRIFG